MLKNFSIPQCFLLAAVLVLVFFVVYSPHLYYDYSYPLHYDEWIHVNAAKILINSWTGDVDLPTNLVMDTQYEYAFDILLSLIEIIPAVDLVTFYQFLPAIIAIISSLLLFIFVWRINNNFYSAILAILLFSLLKSNVNLLGLWFFLPSTLSYLFLFLVFIYISRFFSTNNKKDLYLFYLFSLFLFVFYPPNAIFIFPVIMLTYFLNKGWKDFFKFLLINALIILFSLVINYLFSRYYWDVNFFNTILKDIKNLIFFKGWSGFTEHTYFLPAFYGYIASGLAFIGFIVNIKNKKLYLINFLSVWVIINLLLYKFFSFTIFSFYQRIFYLGLICLAVLSAVGLTYILKKIKTLLYQKKSNIIQVIYYSLVTLALIVILYQPITSYHKLDITMQPVKLVNVDDLKPLCFIKSNLTQKNILAPKLFSVVIFPLTENYSVALLSDMLISRGHLVYDPYPNFMIRNDDARKIIKERYNFNYIYTAVKFDSEISNLIYDDGKRFIYEIE